MPRVVYVNGQYVPYTQAHIHVEDRGFQFADGVYEVIGCVHGHMADETGHLDRLERSLSELQMDMPVSRETLRFLMRECLRRNGLANAGIYIQITRGQAKRDFKFPAGTSQSLVIIVSPFDFDGNLGVANGVRVKTLEDIRWKRRDVKSVALLPQVLAKQDAIDSGVDDAWMVDGDGYVTEGSASNAWIITKDGTLVTRPVSYDILRGVTRTAIEKICRENDLQLEERLFTPKEAYEANEAFTSSATALITPVIEIDGHKIGDGKPGKMAHRLYEEYRAYVDGLRGKQVHWESGL
ncbi:MAG: D-amino acid aminotransferase [Micavibrio sp.]|nr:D-amino acid aminotransferase [Micavibrio sp.]|tara:strand:+ start:370 stop:1254 length:885 start_codon:yes stop_codon:yes gene_type:complete